MEQDCSQWKCKICGNVGLSDGEDGYFYCLTCGSQADDVIDTGVADEDFVDKGTQGLGQGGGAVYLASHTRNIRQSVTPAAPISQFDPHSQQYFSNLMQEHGAYDDNGDAFDGVGPSGTSDFGSSSMGVYSYEEYYKVLRYRYMMGLQMMIQAQCEALVEKFNVNPLICGIVGPIWLRFVASTRLFDDAWADEAIHLSEIQESGEAEKDKRRYSCYKAEPHNIRGQRSVIIWHKYLRKKIPLSCSLAISLLACHVAREAVLPTDIIKWSVGGELTYFDAFVEIEKRIERPLRPFPVSFRSMFRPKHAVNAQKLESLAAKIAQCIGLNLPPVNFYEIASRYLKELSLPLEKILPHACRLHEWVLPPELRLSANSNGLPTRVYVMSILVVAIRILYNINGFGVWEKTLSCHNVPVKSKAAASKDPTISPKMRDNAEDGSGSPHNLEGMGTSSPRNSVRDHDSKFDAAELLHNLEARYNEINYADADVKLTDLSKSMPTYLQFCRDVIFAGSELPLDFNQEEQSLIDKFWDFYQKEKGSESVENVEKRVRSADSIEYEPDKEVTVTSPSEDDRTSDEDLSLHKHKVDNGSSLTSEEHENFEAGGDSAETSKQRAIRLMKKNMEENRFIYIPPRVKLKRLDYLHYIRKNDEGVMTYVAHADYYILLRSCAMVAEVDMRVMHVGVLSMERRLAWLEKRVDHCLHLTPPTATCKFCTDATEHVVDDPMVGLSELDL